MNDIELVCGQHIQALKKIRAQLLILYKHVEELLVNNSIACRTDNLKDGVEGDASAAKARQNTVHRDVYLHLALATNKGLTSSQLFLQLQADREVSWDAVRQALNRMRKSGEVRREGKLWCVIMHSER